MFKKLLSIFCSICIGSSIYAKGSGDSPNPGDAKLTKKQAEELAKYTKKDLLLNPLTVVPGGKNRFQKDTLYIMKNFTIVQKISGGYLITAKPVVWDSGNSMTFGIAFLKTNKKLPQGVLITGVVAYDGIFQYPARNGFEQSVPKLKIPGGLPLSGIRPGGDPFEPEYF